MPTDEQRINPDLLRKMARAAGFRLIAEGAPGWKRETAKATTFTFIPLDSTAGDYEYELERTYSQLSRDPEYLMSEVRARDAETQALREALEKLKGGYRELIGEANKESIDTSPDIDCLAEVDAALAGGEEGEVE